MKELVKSGLFAISAVCSFVKWNAYISEDVTSDPALYQNNNSSNVFDREIYDRERYADVSLVDVALLGCSIAMPFAAYNFNKILDSNSSMVCKILTASSVTASFIGDLYMSSNIGYDENGTVEVFDLVHFAVSAGFALWGMVENENVMTMLIDNANRNHVSYYQALRDYGGFGV